MSAFAKLPPKVWEKIQMGAGMAVDDFNPETGEIGRQLGATDGGFSFDPKPTYEDFGSDIDNAPPNTWQLKRVQYYDPTVSGTFKTMDGPMALGLNGAGDFADEDQTHIVPSHELTEANFADFWVIADYSNINEGARKGYIAIHLLNAMNVLGFRWQTTKNAKGQFAFEYHGHYDIENIDKVPFEIYVKAGTAETDEEDNGEG